jgi:hypothetical protein
MAFLILAQQTTLEMQWCLLKVVVACFRVVEFFDVVMIWTVFWFPSRVSMIFHAGAPNLPLFVLPAIQISLNRITILRPEITVNEKNDDNRIPGITRTLLMTMFPPTVRAVQMILMSFANKIFVRFYVRPKIPARIGPPRSTAHLTWTQLFQYTISLFPAKPGVDEIRNTIEEVKRNWMTKSASRVIWVTSNPVLVFHNEFIPLTSSPSITPVGITVGTTSSPAIHCRCRLWRLILFMSHCGYFHQLIEKR